MHASSSQLNGLVPEDDWRSLGRNELVILLVGDIWELEWHTMSLATSAQRVDQDDLNYIEGMERTIQADRAKLALASVSRHIEEYVRSRNQCRPS